MTTSTSGRGGVDRLAHLLEGATAADIGYGLIDALIGRLRLLMEKRRHRHDHAALAISALRNVAGDPGLLNLVQGASRGQPFDGGDLFAVGVPDRHPTGAHRDAIDVDGAGPALCNAATVFGSSKPDILPDRPKQRRIRLDVDVECFAVDREACHRVSPSWSIPSSGPGTYAGLEQRFVQIKIIRLQRGIIDLVRRCLARP